MTLPPIKIGLIALMGVAAVGMGYTTLFPDVKSEYAGASVQQEEQGNHSDAESGREVPVSSSLSTLSAEAPMALEQSVGAVSEGLAQQMAKLNLEPESVVPLPPLSDDIETYLNKLSELNMATLDADVREQNLRSQPDSLETELSLIGAPVSVTPVVSTSSRASKEVQTAGLMLGSLVQIDNGAWQARINLHGRWHKVQKGTVVGTLSIISVNEQGVRLRDNGAQRFLRMEGF
ncbi:Type IV pilus biogenesis protein PilP [Vibrio crassostreae]|nr:Type IV pilus biogenesis protein PilP [Vibrio crassostreae]